MDTNCLKQLRLLELALLHGSGSRRAAAAAMWFSETTHIALDSAAARQIEEVRLVYQLRFSVSSL
jgi:hypothetical protein